MPQQHMGQPTRTYVSFCCPASTAALPRRPRVPSRIAAPTNRPSFSPHSSPSTSSPAPRADAAEGGTGAGRAASASCSRRRKWREIDTLGAKAARRTQPNTSSSALAPVDLPDLSDSLIASGTATPHTCSAQR